MIKELLDGLKARVKGAGEKGSALPPTGGMPPSPLMPPPSAGGPASSSAPGAPAPTSTPPAPSTEDFSALLGGGDSGELENKVKALEEKTNKLESTVKETLDITKSNKSRLDSIDSSMKKFLSLYELVTNQINPFVDAKPPFAQMDLLDSARKAQDKKDPQTEGAKEEQKKEEPKLEVKETKKVEPKREEVSLPENFEVEEAPRALRTGAVGKPDVTGNQEKVMFLQSMKDGNASFVVEWITSLVGEGGNIEKNTQFLRYLLQMGWITPKAYEALLQHVQAISQSARMQSQPQRIPLAVGVPQSQHAMPQGQVPFPRGNFRGQGGARGQVGDDQLMAVLDWVKYLVDKAGYAEAADVLKYLVKLEWITPEAHEALLHYIQKSMPPQEGLRGHMGLGPKPQARVVLSPNQIPSPAEFMKAEREEYRIPIQPTDQVPTPLQPMPQMQPMREQSLPQIQYQSRQPQRTIMRPQADSIIPLTDLGSDIESLAIILEWIRYLVDRAGTQGAKTIFNYYQNIGWIDQRVYQQLVKYVDGIKVSEEETVGYQPSVEDHATSLFFISKLKHMDVSEEDIQSMLGGGR
jgi:archaellum component FlaD/FlaE